MQNPIQYKAIHGNERSLNQVALDTESKRVLRNFKRISWFKKTDVNQNLKKKVENRN